MTLFLTSSPGGLDHSVVPPVPCALDSRNGFITLLRSLWKDPAKALFIAATPDDPQGNERYSGILQSAFSMSDLPIAQMDICDDRNPTLSLSQYDFIILSGGHVPTQNAFFQKIGLKDAIGGFQGIVMGISAGTMNTATTVYAQPELEGEAVDPDYSRFISGLGLTDIMILPHFQEICDTMLDGLHNTRDLLLPDSMGKKIYALVDGSFLLIQDGITRLMGEAYLAENGTLVQICQEGSSITL